MAGIPLEGTLHTATATVYKLVMRQGSSPLLTQPVNVSPLGHLDPQVKDDRFGRL